MANLQVKNVPDSLHERLRRHAHENNCTISAAVLAAVERELVNWEWRKRLAQRPETDLGIEATEILREEHALRSRECGGGTSAHMTPSMWPPPTPTVSRS